MQIDNSTDALKNEQVAFIQHDIPGLDDGQYQLRAVHQVNDSTGKAISDPIQHTATFAVLGDRFRLKKPDIVFSVFPHDNASGEYTSVLPHVVFKKTSFPWARYPTNEPPYAPPPPGEDTDADVPTWLTVLLLDEDDVAAFPGLALTPASATLGDLYPTTLYSGSTLGPIEKDHVVTTPANYSYFQRATKISLDPGDALTDTIQVLDVPLALFWQLAPTVADLKLMAHVRQVSLLHKPTIAGVSDQGEPLGAFSIVFGNRFPQPKKKTYAYLVSLEELEDFLPTDENGGPPAGNTFDGARFLRLAVLKSWVFYATDGSATFVKRVLDLNGAPAPGQEAAFTNLILPYSGSNKVVAAALGMGYVPLNHDLRTAEKTVSWYRGPLAPYLIDKDRVRLPVASPDQALIFDPTTGMFDASYAAAWTLGRLLALQDAGFSNALYKWKRGLSQAVVNGVENDILSRAFAPVLARPPVQMPLVVSQRESPPAGADLWHKTIQALHPESTPL